MQGVILGTAAYMSPEQARGQAVDKRTDIWAFGCVLYEMLTGRRAFEGSSATDIIASIIKTESQIGSGCRAPCLQEPDCFCVSACRRTPRGVLHEIADARFEVDEILADAPAPSADVAATIVRGKRLPAALAAIIAVIAGVSALAMWYGAATRTDDQRAFEFQVSPPDGVVFSISTITGAIAVPYPATLPRRSLPGICRDLRRSDAASLGPRAGLRRWPAGARH